MSSHGSDDGDLFGDGSIAGSIAGSDAGTPPPADYNNRRQLDSDDDDKRRTPSPDLEDARIMDANIVPQRVPTSSQGFNVLRLPEFVKTNPVAFDESKYEVPEGATDFAEANTIRYMKDEFGEMVSNATYNKWSDGSITISIGGNTFEIMSKPLAPKNPKSYNELLDSHTYLVAPHVDQQMMQVVGHVNDEMTIKPNKAIEAEMNKKLIELRKMPGRDNDHKGVMNTIVRMEDPDAFRKQLEQQERERARLEKRREVQASRSLAAGARLGGLGSSRPKAAARLPRKGGARNAARAEYSSDDEPRYGGRQDAYDEEDPFLAGSDEEELVDDDDDEEAEYERSPKKDNKRKADSDADASGDEAEKVFAAPRKDGGRRKRQVIEDDEDDE